MSQDRPTFYARSITTPRGRNEREMIDLVDQWLYADLRLAYYNPEISMRADDALALSISGKMREE